MRNQTLGVTLGEASHGGPALPPECPSQSVAPPSRFAQPRHLGTPPDLFLVLTLSMQCIGQSIDYSFKLPLFSPSLPTPSCTDHHSVSCLGHCRSADCPAYGAQVTMHPPIDLLSADTADSLTHDPGRARIKPGLDMRVMKVRLTPALSPLSPASGSWTARVNTHPSAAWTAQAVLADPGAPVGCSAGDFGKLEPGARSPCIPLGDPGTYCGGGFDSQDRTHFSEEGSLQARRCSACGEVSGECGENTGPENRAEEALQCPWVEASPLPLRTLCLAAMNTILSTSALQDTVDLLEKALKSLPLKVSKATDAKPILKSSEKDGEQLQKNATNDLNENTHFPASPLVLRQDKSRCEKMAQEKEEDKESLEQLNTRIQPILKDKVSQVLSVVADPLHTISLPDLLTHQVDDGNTEVQQKRDAGMDEPSVPQSEVGLREVTDDAHLSVPLQSPKEEHQERARWLQQQKQIEEELPGEILSLQTEEATLQHENTKLEGEIQQLELKLQILHELHDEEVGPLYRKFFEEERVCSELDKKLLNVCWDMNSTYQLRNLYKKMAEDLAQ
nr:uncharacterized protein LOC123278137 [Equus asinus]